jgi:hypothetical protein
MVIILVSEAMVEVTVYQCDGCKRQIEDLRYSHARLCKLCMRQLLTVQ